MKPFPAGLDFSDCKCVGILGEVVQEGLVCQLLRRARRGVDAKDAVVEEAVGHPVSIVSVLYEAHGCFQFVLGGDRL